MNVVVDNVLVAAVLLASLGYALVKLGPRTMRMRILAALGVVLASAPRSLKVAALAQRLAVAAGKTQIQSACGGCDNCAAPSPAAAPPSEVNVPVAKISRRV